MPLPASLLEGTSSVGLSRLITTCGFKPVMSPLALKPSVKFDRGQYLVDELPFLGYELETVVVPDTVVMRTGKLPKLNGEVVLDVSDRKVAWLQVSSYTSIGSCGLEWKRFNDEIDKEEVPGDDNVQDIDSLEVLQRRNAG